MLKIISTCSLIALLLVSLVAIRSGNAHLRHETTRLARQNEQIRRFNEYDRQLQVMNDHDLHDERLRALSELADLQAQARQKYDRLHEEAASRAAALASNRDPLTGMTRLEYFRNVGRATPASATQTLMWAALNGDNKALVAMLTVKGEARDQAEAVIANLPPQMREQYPDPEALAALFISETLVEGVSAAQIVAQSADDPQHVTVTVLGPSGGKEQMNMQLSPDGWQMVVSPRLIERIQARFK